MDAEMGNAFFQFKKFRIYQDRCAMKVGTDGVLLGAWCSVSHARRILDVGTGTGLIALMIAQRTAESVIDAVEIDSDAARQASENVAMSEWKNRISVFCLDFNRFCIDKEPFYDLIVSNPPFFENSLLPPDVSRRIARHTETFGLEDLFFGASRLLSEAGVLSIIYPASGLLKMKEVAKSNSLFLSRLMYVKGRDGGEVKRVLTEWKRKCQPVEEDEMSIEVSRHVYTEKYIDLTRDFYLRM